MQKGIASFLPVKAKKNQLVSANNRHDKKNLTVVFVALLWVYLGPKPANSVMFFPSNVYYAVQ